MLNLSLNYNNIAHPVIEESKRDSFFKRILIRYFERFRDRKLKKLSDTIDYSILSIEGSYDRLKELSTEKAKNALVQIKKTIKSIDKIYGQMEGLKMFEYDEALRVKFRYMQKCLYKAESIAHKISYKDSQVLKTDSSIKEGIIKMNASYHKAK